MTEHTSAYDYASIRAYLAGKHAGSVKFYDQHGVEIAQESGFRVYEDRDGVHFLLRDNGRLAKAPGGASIPKIPDMARAVVSADDFRPDMAKRLRKFLADNEPVGRGVCEVFRVRCKVERKVWSRQGEHTSMEWVECFMKGDEGASYLTWLASWMCNYLEPFQAGETLMSHRKLDAVLGKDPWPLSETTWSALAELGTYIYMEYRKALTPVEGK